MLLTKKNKIIFNIVAAISIIIVCCAISPKTLQNDTYYTLRIGKQILENGIDMQDHFSWHEGLKYTYPHWLYDVMMYLIYSISSWDGIYYSTCILASLLGMTIYFTNVKNTKKHLIPFLFTLIIMYLLKDFIAARAQLVTFILFAIEIFLLEQFMLKPKKIYAVCLALLSLLIANLHCAVWPFFFVLFMPYIVEYLFILYYDSDVSIKLITFIKKIKIKMGIGISKNEDREKLIEDEDKKLKLRLEKINNVRKEERKNSYKIIIEKNNNIKYLMIVFIICALMGLITPIKDTPYTYLIKTMQGNTTENINEHSPITFWENQPMLCVFVAIITFFTFTKTKIKLRDFFMLCGLMLLTVMSKRQSTMLLIIGTFIFNKYIAEYIDKSKIKNFLISISKVIGSIVGGTLIIAIVALIGINLNKDIKDDKYISEKTYPVQASDFILNNIDLNTAKFYNEYNYGSYMLFREIPVFVDSRADLYAPEFNEGRDVFSDFLDISNFGTDYEKKFNEYGITHVIVYKDSRLNNVLELNNKYKQLYSDKHFVIYER